LTGMPSPSWVESKIPLLSNVGAYFKSIPRESFDNVVVNTENSFFEKIDEYLPFDVYSMTDGTFVWRFTRDEFASLIETKKNYYDGTPLSPNVLLSLQLRLKIASMLELPSCRPFVELYSSIVRC
jgi:hypothetical protein